MGTPCGCPFLEPMRTSTPPVGPPNLWVPFFGAHANTRTAPVGAALMGALSVLVNANLESPGRGTPCGMPFLGAHATTSYPQVKAHLDGRRLWTPRKSRVTRITNAHLEALELSKFGTVVCASIASVAFLSAATHVRNERPRMRGGRRKMRSATRAGIRKPSDSTRHEPDISRHDPTFADETRHESTKPANSRHTAPQRQGNRRASASEKAPKRRPEPEIDPENGQTYAKSHR